MRLPSVNTIVSRLEVPREIAQQIRTILKGYEDRNPFRRPRPVRIFEEISGLIGGMGYEFIPPGNNEKSPKIHYVNRGDTYAETVLFVNGRLSIGAWGTIVERGNYS